MKDYPRHNSRKLLWIFQDSQTLTHPDSFAFHSLWHNFTPVVVVGGWWAMACRSLQNFIVVLKQKVYLFPFLSISKTIAFGGSPPRTFATPNTSIHFIFSFLLLQPQPFFFILIVAAAVEKRVRTSQSKSGCSYTRSHLSQRWLGVRTTHFYDFGHRLSVIVDTVVT